MIVEFATADGNIGGLKERLVHLIYGVFYFIRNYEALRNLRFVNFTHEKDNCKCLNDYAVIFTT